MKKYKFTLALLRELSKCVIEETEKDTTACYVVKNEDVIIAVSTFSEMLKNKKYFKEIKE